MRYPRSASCQQRWEPTKPAPPVINTSGLIAFASITGCPLSPRSNRVPGRRSPSCSVALSRVVVRTWSGRRRSFALLVPVKTVLVLSFGDHIGDPERRACVVDACRAVTMVAESPAAELRPEEAGPEPRSRRGRRGRRIRSARPVRTGDRSPCRAPRARRLHHDGSPPRRGRAAHAAALERRRSPVARRTSVRSRLPPRPWAAGRARHRRVRAAPPLYRRTRAVGRSKLVERGPRPGDGRTARRRRARRARPHREPPCGSHTVRRHPQDRGGAVRRLAGGRVRRRSLPREAMQPPGGSTSELIEQGARTIQTLVEAAIAAHDEAPTLELSGGIDSRALLAAIPPHVRPRLRTITLGTPTSPDLVVARRDRGPTRPRAPDHRPHGAR